MQQSEGAAGTKQESDVRLTDDRAPARAAAVTRLTLLLHDFRQGHLGKRASYQDVESRVSREPRGAVRPLLPLSRRQVE